MEIRYSRSQIPSISYPLWMHQKEHGGKIEQLWENVWIWEFIMIQINTSLFTFGDNTDANSGNCSHQTCQDV